MMTRLILFCSCLGMICHAAMTPSQILEESTRVSRETSYQAVMIATGDKQTITYMYYHRANPDGTVDTLMKTMDPKNGMGFLTNAKGRFELIGDTAIRTDYFEIPERPAPIVPILKDKDTIILDGKEFNRNIVGEKAFAIMERMAKNGGRDPEAKRSSKDISLKNTNYYGYPCYLIRYKSETNNGMYTNELTIDQSTYFCYQQKRFNARGKCVFDAVYRDVVFDPVFEPGLFDVPNGTKIVIAKTLQEGNKQSLAALNRADAPPQIAAPATRWLAALGRSVRDMFWNNTTPISCVLAAIALSIFAVAGIARFRQKHRV